MGYTQLFISIKSFKQIFETLSDAESSGNLTEKGMRLREELDLFKTIVHYASRLVLAIG